jgi:hypothetical protein
MRRFLKSVAVSPEPVLHWLSWMSCEMSARRRQAQLILTASIAIRDPSIVQTSSMINPALLKDRVDSADY